MSRNPQQISSKRFSDHFLLDARAWFVWSFAGLFYMYQLILRISPGVMVDDLMYGFSVEACALGLLSACYLVTYTILQIPLGLSMDKVGPTQIIRWSIILCVIGTVIFATAESFYLACFGRLLIGAGSTSAFLGSLKLATNWFHPERLALVVGFTMLAGTVGATFGQAPLALLIELFEWRGALLYVVVPVGLLIALCVFLFVRDDPPEGPMYRETNQDTSIKTLMLRLREIVSNYRVWLFGFYGALMYSPILVFVDLWGVGFLTKLYDIDKATAGSITTMFYFGVGVGSPVVAFYSDTIRGRKLPMILGALFSLVCSVLIVYATGLPLWTMYGLLFLAGFVFSSQPLIFSSVCQLIPHASSGTAISFTNMLVMLLGLILQPFVGWLLDWIWDGVMNNGIPLYTVSDYRFALLTVPVCLILALVITPFIPETFPKEEKA